MNNNFWKEMVKTWCKFAHQLNTDSIHKLAAEHAAKDISHTAGYSVNPLDDDDDEEDW